MNRQAVSCGCSRREWSFKSVNSKCSVNLHSASRGHIWGGKRFHITSHGLECKRNGNHPLENLDSNQAFVSRLSHVEAYVRWSLTRDMIRACGSSQFYLFTFSSTAVHVIRARFFADTLEISRWLFDARCGLDEMMSALNVGNSLGNKSYFLLPSATQYAGATWHAARQLSKRNILKYCAEASVVHLGSLSRCASATTQRTLGTDAHVWLERMCANIAPGALHECQREVHEDYLTSAICADLATIIRLMHTTPGMS